MSEHSTENLAVDQDIEFGSDHGSVKSYIIGFIISIVLTVIPFTLVMKRMLTDKAMFVAIAVLALAQLFVQLVFFLHLSTNSKARWNLSVFIFTLVVVLILVIGSLWIMYSLNYYMVN